MRLWVVAVVVLFLSTPGAEAQRLTKTVAKTARQKARNHAKGRTRRQPTVRTPQSQSLARRMARTATRRGELDKSESYVVRRVGGNLHGLYVKSQLLPGQYDRILLFQVGKSGRARMLSTAEVFAKLAESLPYRDLVGLWKDTVAVIKTPTYHKSPTVRVQVESELRFLEKEIEKRAGKSQKLPWSDGTFDPAKELGKLGDGNRMLKALERGRLVDVRSLEMLQRGIYKLYGLHDLPKKEFMEILKTAELQSVPEIANAKPSDYRKIKDPTSTLAKAIRNSIYGMQFGKMRSALVIPRRFDERLHTLVHELNHGANRIPTKKSYGKRETLALEFTAHAVEQKRSKRQYPALKRQIITNYGLGNIKENSVPKTPRGIIDNWVPRFPTGQEKSYLRAYFRDPATTKK